MQTLKITTFLMCPDREASASGGSPEASTSAAGHIKKAPGPKAERSAAKGQTVPLLNSCAEETHVLKHAIRGLVDAWSGVAVDDPHAIESGDGEIPRNSLGGAVLVETAAQADRVVVSRVEVPSLPTLSLQLQPLSALPRYFVPACSSSCLVGFCFKLLETVCYGLRGHEGSLGGVVVAGREVLVYEGALTLVASQDRRGELIAVRDKQFPALNAAPHVSFVSGFGPMNHALKHVDGRLEWDTGEPFAALGRSATPSHAGYQPALRDETGRMLWAEVPPSHATAQRLVAAEAALKIGRDADLQDAIHELNDVEALHLNALLVWSKAKQVVSSHAKALADNRELRGGRLGAPHFPAGDGAFGEVLAVSAKALAKLLLRKSGGVPASR